MQWQHNMENKEINQDAYLIESIFLVESNYMRLPSIDFSNPINSILSVNIDTGGDLMGEDGRFGVLLTVSIKGQIESVKVYEITVRMIGMFVKIGSPEPPLEIFKKINAPAIIYPYIREHVHNLNNKAGINNIILPPVNFYKTEIVTYPSMPAIPQ